MSATASRCVEGYRTPDEAMGEVPTAANLNLYRRGNSCVRWHCDDEPLFGECGETSGASALLKWKGKSCPDNEAHLCCLCHGDSLVMDGQCQDAFLHCTDPCLEQERINVAFRWIKRHTASCALRTGVVCCLPSCAQGSSAAVAGSVVGGAFLALWVLLGVLCIWGLLALLGLLLMSTRLGLRRCAYRWTRCTKMCSFFQGGSDPSCNVPYVLALAGDSPVSMVIMHVWYFWAKAFWRNCRQIFT